LTEQSGPLAMIGLNSRGGRSTRYTQSAFDLALGAMSAVDDRILHQQHIAIAGSHQYTLDGRFRAQNALGMHRKKGAKLSFLFFRPSLFFTVHTGRVKNAVSLSKQLLGL